MSTFVLVHGAWHGGWCWSKVKHALEAASGTVHTPTLTGLGERAHLASREICLETHIEDVVRLVDYELLTDVILVGHSYAGVVVTAVADRVAECFTKHASTLRRRHEPYWLIRAARHPSNGAPHRSLATPSAYAASYAPLFSCALQRHRLVTEGTGTFASAQA